MLQPKANEQQGKALKKESFLPSCRKTDFSKERKNNLLLASKDV